MYDVIIIGGSYAGLSAAMALGRAMRKVLVIDSGKPCNAQTPAAHNFLTRDGLKPAEISAIAREEVGHYPDVRLLSDYVTDASGNAEEGFSVRTKAADYDARSLIFATGVKDRLPELPGFAECWGITAIHCPYCHGYEVRGEVTGILSNGEGVPHHARLIRNWTDRLTVYTDGPATFDKAEVEKLGIAVIENPVAAIEHESGHMSALRFADGRTTEITALYHSPPFEQHCKLPIGLGCELTDDGYLSVSEFQQTGVAGVYAVGDATTPLRAISVAVASGTKAGGMLNNELVQSEMRAAE